MIINNEIIWYYNLKTLLFDFLDYNQFESLFSNLNKFSKIELLAMAISMDRNQVQQFIT